MSSKSFMSLSDSESTEDRKTLDSIREELKSLGIDAPRVTYAAYAVSYAETFVRLVERVQYQDRYREVRPELREWEVRLARESQLEPAVLRRRLGWLAAILGLTLSISLGTIVVFAIGLLATELARFVGFGIFTLSSVLSLSAVLIIVQLLWGAYVFERTLRSVAAGYVLEMRDVLNTALGYTNDRQYTTGVSPAAGA